MSDHNNQGVTMGKATEQQRVIEIIWEVPGLPRLVGPFDTLREAEDWGRLNIPNGTWEIRPLAFPYLRSNRLPDDAGVSV